MLRFKYNAKILITFWLCAFLFQSVFLNAAVTKAADVKSTTETFEIFWEGEHVDAGTTTGVTRPRSNASSQKTHGVIGASDTSGWPAEEGSVVYSPFEIPLDSSVSMTICYSKNSISNVPVQVYVDNEQNPRISFTPTRTWDWNSFRCDTFGLGEIVAGVKTIRLHTQGQKWSVLEVDSISLIVTPKVKFSITYQGENAISASTGEIIDRSNASGAKVHGRIGASAAPGYPPESGSVSYNVDIPATSDNVQILVRYSKNTVPATPVRIYLNDEQSPRTEFIPDRTGAAWTDFTTGVFTLGSVPSGVAVLRFEVTGEQWGVFELDEYTIYN